MNRTLAKAKALRYNIQGKREKLSFVKLLLHKLIIG